MQYCRWCSWALVSGYGLNGKERLKDSPTGFLVQRALQPQLAIAFQRAWFHRQNINMNSFGKNGLIPGPTAGVAVIFNQRSTHRIYRMINKFNCSANIIIP
jgi:hypothetical protein